jgi:hypothetical protein
MESYRDNTAGMNFSDQSENLGGASRILVTTLDWRQYTL